MMAGERLAPQHHDTIEDIPAPAENPTLVGHEQVRAALGQSYRSGKLHHALLLSGPEGIGKATLAFHIANHLLRFADPASAPPSIGAPDPSSPLFRAIAQGAHPSVLHLTRPAAASGKGFKTALTVDEVRRVNRFLSMSAHDGGWRVVIVDPADDMNANAANALLKNLEEPPRKTLFVLIAHEPGRLLPTIRSRCRLERLDALSDQELFAALAALGAMPVEDAKAELALRADGSVRRALLLTLYGGLEIAAALDDILSASRFSPSAGMKLAEAVTQRDNPMQFDLFVESLMEAVSTRALAAAEQRAASNAARMAQVWDDLRLRFRNLDVYNLDKRQNVLEALAHLHGAISRG